MYLLVHVLCVCCINIYGVGYGVAVCNERQYQSLCKWNGKIAVPLFYLYIAELQSWKLRFSYMSISFGKSQID